MKIKLFTHTDLDGVGCAIVTMFYSKRTNSELDIEYLNYDKNMISRLTNFFTEEYKSYDEILLGDLCLKENETELIQLISKVNETIQVKFIDHHDSSLHLNKFNWALVETHHENNCKACGASLMYDSLRVDHFRLSFFIEKIRKYDTWEWVTLHNKCEDVENSQILFELIGLETFVTTMFNRIYNDENDMITNLEYKIINNQREKRESYFKRKLYSDPYYMKTGVPCNSNKKEELIIRVIICEQLHSGLGEYILSNDNKCNTLLMYDSINQSCSLRTKLDIKLNKVAELFGGGGHPQACGFPLELNKNILRDIEFGFHKDKVSDIYRLLIQITGEENIKE